MKWIGIFICLPFFSVQAQDVAPLLKEAVTALEGDSQMNHALLAMYVAETTSGKAVFAHHEQIGLAAASTQKIITAASAYEILGSSFVYKTAVGFEGAIKNGILNGVLIIKASGDPSLGSWRWEQTKKDNQLRSIVTAVKKAGIQQMNGGIVIEENRFSKQTIPDGWIWQDIGNYYGAGAGALNWGENQYDITLSSGAVAGTPAKISGISHNSKGNIIFDNELQSAPKGSGDNAYIYLPIAHQSFLLKGTIPVNETAFEISGADPLAKQQFEEALIKALAKEDINVLSSTVTRKRNAAFQQLTEIRSPDLDTLQFHFLRKSINLYGEAFVKSIALQKENWASTENGMEQVKKFWANHGIESSAIQIIDGSGLSPQNRVTAFSLVQVLQFAKNKNWFPSFYHALPVYNGMKLKSGSIGGARAFAGYHTSKSGKQYTIAIIVNNYDGSSTAMVKKLFRLLDILK